MQNNEISIVLNCHANENLVKDTLESVKKYVTDNIIVLIDGCSWEDWGKNVNLGSEKLKGLYHGKNKAPYKNLTYGLLKIHERYPNSDWFCYIEPDVLFVSDRFKEDLNDCWCIGSDLRYYQYNLPFFVNMTKFQFKHYCYLLGCCVFYHKDFIKKLKELNIFEKIINWTSGFQSDSFPDYSEQNGYDFGEILFPSMAEYLGGKIKEFSRYDSHSELWQGNFEKYPIRFKPEINDCNLSKASIVHPIKDTNSMIRKKSKIIRSIRD